MKEKYEREMEILRLKSQLEGKIAVTNASDAAIAAKDSL